MPFPQDIPRGRLFKNLPGETFNAAKKHVVYSKDLKDTNYNSEAAQQLVGLNLPSEFSTVTAFLTTLGYLNGILNDMLVADVRLSNDDILDLYLNPFTIVPLPPAGNSIIPLAAYVEIMNEFGVYDASAGAIPLSFNWVKSDNTIEAGWVNEPAGFDLTAMTNNLYSYLKIPINIDMPSDSKDYKFCLAQQGAGNYTGGDDSSYIRIRLYYVLIAPTLPAP